MKIIEYLRNPPPPPLRLVVSLRRACRNTLQSLIWSIKNYHFFLVLKNKVVEEDRNLSTPKESGRWIVLHTPLTDGTVLIIV